jgi:hypothetical protein
MVDVQYNAVLLRYLSFICSKVETELNYERNNRGGMTSLSFLSSPYLYLNFLDADSVSDLPKDFWRFPDKPSCLVSQYYPRSAGYVRTADCMLNPEKPSYLVSLSLNLTYRCRWLCKTAECMLNPVKPSCLVILSLVPTLGAAGSVRQQMAC